jgi:hypothetical protein
MEKKLFLLGVALVLVGLCSSVTLALDPIGPPVAGCKQNQFSVGFEYAYGEMDLEASGPLSKTSHTKAVIEDVESNKYFARIGYGLSDDWEIFTRIGIVDAEFDGDGSSPDFESDEEFAFGVGTKKTFVDNGDVKWGAVFQFSWAGEDMDDRFSGQSISFANGGISASSVSKVELEWYEIQLALGPQWMVEEGIYLYGGPFLHFLEGDLDLETAPSSPSTRYEYEIEQESEFGGFVGCLVELDPHIAANVEGQYTNDAWLLVAGVTWLF